MDKPAIILDSAEEMREARLNQPRVSSEEFLRRMEQHRLASEAFAEDAKSATSRVGRRKAVAG